MSDQDEKLKVLIVDDQELFRIGLTVTLNRVEGVSIIGECGDGQTAVRMCLSLNPDVVLMDLAMPVMNGIDATQEIKKAQPEIRIIMLTTHESDEDVFAALGAGADAYCLKSIETAELGVVLKTVATGAAWLDPAIARRVLRSVQPAPTKSGNQSYGLVTNLSPRELEVLGLVVEGLSNQQMAQRLFVSNDTIKSHMRHIMEKLLVSDRTQAAVKALKMGLISPP